MAQVGQKMADGNAGGFADVRQALELISAA
jgi:hypothetical protein